MSALNFPSGAVTGDQYTGDNGSVYVFDGVKWVGDTISLVANPNALVNNGHTVQLDGAGRLVLPAYTFPATAGTNGQVLVWPGSGSRLVWANQSGSGGGGGDGTVWTNDANGCLRAELSSTGFEAFTDATHLDLQDSGQWTIGSYQYGTFIGNDEFTNVNILSLRSGDDTYITTNLRENGNHQWKFGADGNLTLPVDSRITASTPSRGTIVTGISNYAVSTGPNTYRWSAYDAGIQDIFYQNIEGWQFNRVAGGSNATVVSFVANLQPPATFTITFDGQLLSGSTFTAQSPDYVAEGNNPVVIGGLGNNTWSFGTDGKLTLPAGGDIVDSNGTSVLGGGGGSTLVNGSKTVSLDSGGNLTFADTGGTFFGNGYLQSGTNGTNIGIKSWDGRQKVFVNETNATIQTVSNLSQAYNWVFNKDGTIEFPDNKISQVSDSNLGIQTSKSLTTDNIIANGSEFNTDQNVNGFGVINGWSQRNAQQIEMNLFVAPAPIWVLLTQLALGRTVIVTYSTGSGNQTFTSVLSQLFTATGQYDQFSRQRYSGRIDGTIPANQTGIVSINFPELSTQTNNWQFSDDGNLTFPNGSTIGASDPIFGVPITTTRGSIFLGNQAECLGGENHFHIMKAGQQEIDLFLGDDYNYVKLPSTGGVEISSSLTGDQFLWQFGGDGSLTLPKASSVSEVTPATGAAANVIVIQMASSIANISFVSVPPAPILDYTVPGTDIVVDVNWNANGSEYYSPRFTVVDGGTGHTGGGQFGGGEVLTVPYADMGITTGGNWTWYVVDIASDLVLEAGLKDWTFAADGVITLPNSMTIGSYGTLGENAFLEIGGDDTRIGIDNDGAPPGFSITTNATGGMAQRVWRFGPDGDITFPDNSVQTTAYTGQTGDANIWIQDFKTTLGAPADVVGMASSVEYLANGDIVALFVHYVAAGGDGESRYSGVARFSPTGEKLWSMRFQGSQYTDGWGLAVDNDGGFIYVAGRSSGSTPYEQATLTKLTQADGTIVWSKYYDVGYDNTNSVVDVATDGNPVVVGFANNGTDNQIVTSKISKINGSIIWSKALNGQGNDEAYGMAVGPSGEVVTVGYMDQVGIIDAAATLYTDPQANPNWTTGVGGSIGGVNFSFTITDGIPTFTNVSDTVGNHTVDQVLGVIGGNAVGGTNPADNVTVKVGTLAANDTNNRILVAKYAANGSIAWQKAVTVDAGFDCDGADADIDGDGNIYVCGNFTYDNNGSNRNAMIIIKFNSSGVKQWTRKVQGDCQDYAASIVVGPDNCLYLSAVTGNDNSSVDYSMVIAKYTIDGLVAWQRLLDNTTTWTFSGGLFFGPGGSGSTIAVRTGYVAVVGGFGDPVGTVPHAILAQFDSEGTVFPVGNYDFKAASFSGLLNSSASNIVVFNAGKTASDYAGTFDVYDFEPGYDPDIIVGTVYRKITADNELRNGVRVVSLSANGSVTLPAGGTITEGYVTSNPTIQLTPASPDVASQKLVIKGGAAAYSFTDNNINISYNNNTAVVTDILTFNVYSSANASQTLYWWIYPENAGIATIDSGTVSINSGGSGVFTIIVASVDYEFTLRVSPENNNYGPGFIGVETGLINASAPTFATDHHLHLTTGDLTETSIFLGTDNHNVRTTVNGNIEITTPNTTNNIWRFDSTGGITFPDNTVQTTAYVTGNQLIWAATDNGQGSITQAVAYDSQGNSYSLIAQGNINSSGVFPATIVKRSSTGSELWKIDLGTDHTVNPWSLVCDGDNNLYVIVQRLNGMVYNNVVLKLNGINGSILWQVNIQDSQDSNNMQAVPFSGYIGMGPASGVIVAGTAYNGSDNDFFITALGADGSFVNTLTYGDEWDQEAYSVAINPMSLEVVLVGRKKSNTDNANYLEIIKFVSGAPPAWQKSITVDGNYDVQASDVCLLPDGNWAVLATHNLANGNYGVITMKINNTAGSVMWSREISQGCTNISSSITADSTGNIYMSAMTYSGNDTPSGGAPITNRLIGAYDTNGNALWQKYFRTFDTSVVLVDPNWVDSIGSTGKQLAVYNDRLLVGTSVATIGQSGPTGASAVVVQLTTQGENETIGAYETRNSYLTDSAVSLTVADTEFNYTISTQTLSTGTSVSTTSSTLTFSLEHTDAYVSQLKNGGKTVTLETNGTLLDGNGRNVTGEFDGVTDSGNAFSNQPISIKNASGYKRLVGLTNSVQTWFNINTVATQLGVNPAWIMGLTIEYQAQSTNFSGGSNASMTGQIIIASSNSSGRDISVTHSEAVCLTGNNTDPIFSKLNMWIPNGRALQAIRTDSNSQQLDIIWTAKVFINASEDYC